MAAALYALLPEAARIGFLPFATLFVLATTAGLLSNVPAGLGVFESVLLLALGSTVAPVDLAVALVAYRVVYFVLPLACAAVVLVAIEARNGRRPAVNRRVEVLTPSVLGLAVAVLGGALLLTGDLPGDSRAPDLSTFSNSVAGLGLLLLARGLHRRLHGAWVCAVAVLLVFSALAVLHSATVEALAGLALVALLLPSRTAFYRTTSVLKDPRGWAWPVAVTALGSLSLWWHDRGVGRSGLPDQTWWVASVASDTPGQARTAVALGLVGVLVGGSRLLGPRREPPVVATPAELALASTVVTQEADCNAQLMFTGEKRLLFSDDGRAVLMYQIEGRSWVVMGDPIGDPAQFPDLVWRFIDRCDSACGSPVFYSVRGDLADLYRVNGLSLVKLGEEAIVPLADFSLDGKGRAKLRQERNQSSRAGVVVQIVPPDQVAPLLPELREVSDAWLAERNAREKRFSLGAFDDEYLQRYPVAVARMDGLLIAFATLWTSGGRHEVKVDLMRRTPNTPRPSMSHLFIESMLWAQAEGYACFNLGMAPLSGLNTDGTAPFWNRIGRLVWTHGEHFYNFQGLRQYKERFDPQWQTRYIASTGGTALPRTMVNVATLVGGGTRAMLGR
jgi:phosphatidylglycerol lysyltransferase